MIIIFLTHEFYVPSSFLFLVFVTVHVVCCVALESAYLIICARMNERTNERDQRRKNCWNTQPTPRVRASVAKNTGEKVVTTHLSRTLTTLRSTTPSLAEILSITHTLWKSKFGTRPSFKKKIVFQSLMFLLPTVPFFSPFLLFLSLSLLEMCALFLG